MPLIRALRVIAGVSPRTRTEPLFNLFKMLPINSIYEYSVCTFMYKYSGTKQLVVLDILGLRYGTRYQPSFS